MKTPSDDKPARGRFDHERMRQMSEEEIQERYRPVRIWRTMEAEARKAAALAFWKSGQVKPEEKAAAVDALATAMRFRHQSIVKASPDKRAGYLAGCNALNDHVVGTILFIYHMETKVPMMIDFLDVTCDVDCMSVPMMKNTDRSLFVEKGLNPSAAAKKSEPVESEPTETLGGSKVH